MPTSVGPNLSSESSLVFNYDTGDLTNSYLGEPTKNELVQITWGGDGADQSGFAKSSTLVTDSSLQYNNYETYLWAPGVSRNVYLNGVDISTTVSSSVWTFSCYAKREDGLPITGISVYMYYPGSDGTGPALIQDAGNGWYRLSRTRVSASYQSYIGLAGFTGFAVNTKYYLSGPQLEMQDHPTQFVYPTQTRSVSASLFDVSGYNKTINCLSASYNSNAQLFFSGSNYLIVNPLSRLITHTIESVFRPTAHPNNKSCIASDQYSTFVNYKLGYESVASMAGGFYDGTWRLTPNIATTLNVWQHVVYTYDGSTLAIYKNGILGGTTLYTGNPNTNGINLRIGRRWDNPEYFIGDIPIVRIYNRALTVDEITNNFNELKTRFNFS